MASTVHGLFEASPFAAALRRFRASRRMSQLELALVSDVSCRHLSFLESDRARPSREMVLKLAAGLLLPLGSRNTLLQAAGYAASFPASALDSAALAPFRAILSEMMERHAPYPALLCDRYWTVHAANATAGALLAGLNDGSGEMNVVRMLAENPLAAELVGNLPEVLDELSGRMQLEALEAGDDPLLIALMQSVGAACLRHPHVAGAPRRPLVPFVLRTPAGPLSFLSTIAHFGTSEDVTVRDLRLELLFPADDHSRAAMHALAAELRA